MGELPGILVHFARLRWARAPRDRATLLRRQQRRLHRFLSEAARLCPLYRGLAPDLAAFPLLTKEAFMANFAALNRHGIGLEEATALALRAEGERDFRPELPGGVTAGLSSGTSGSRQVFLASASDRRRWAGQVLARVLSPQSLRRICNPLAAPLRVAFFLRANSNLYTTVSGRRLKLDYHDLTRPFETLRRELAECPPHILVAPATVLAALARRERERPSGLRPRQVISVAEVLDRRDRAAIESTFGVRVGELYQATEGFLGSSCPEGRIHLHEDALHIEPQWLDDQHERFTPLITDFSRRTQWFIRHPLRDVLRVHRAPCPCGRPTLCLEAVEGRQEEVLWLPDASGAATPVFPDAVRQALYAMADPPDEYRVWQRGLVWEIHLRDPAGSAPVEEALGRLLDRLGLTRPAFQPVPWHEQPPAEKPKRIRCLSPPP